MASKNRANISPEIRADLEYRGVDGVRALLAGMANEPNGTDRRTSIFQADGKKPLLRGDMEDWLKEKKAADDRWVKTAAIAAIVAAVFAFPTWAFPN